ncbi:MAG: symmetrical bis(5'-nucleosyl)-tetraphosphatase [Castellaniella sp.]|uniref:symmetrical bis(5'-nucleosyl)-tetraphosphatase n=1 Tax=Castellaniella sp. TaxID=1955812 RepID=UPI00122187EA|nr:symmetrical bis(5'-nucleosyl)-tetraphosphatase [Castellaniella sp.]TAN27241.1 MAG: symmetrical bis(5'-nucleosyl)-tetraphosphatase [Castellaniella sp.]
MRPPRDVWVIGDVQGCAAPLHALLDHPELSAPDTELWFAGDLVNRGPDSLGALRLIKGLGERARAILGNHDLHLLAVAAGVRKQGKSDTLDDILNAPDAAELLDWIRRLPLLIRDRGHVMVHAGILPVWTLEQAEALAGEIQSALRGPDWRNAMNDLYGEEPLIWDDALRGPARMRVIVNALTRMRVCHADDGSMELHYKGELADAPAGLVPWFELPARRDRSIPVIFGHWSALGLNIGVDTICLDTGCVWGRQLTALRLRDHHIVQQDCTGCR